MKKSTAKGLLRRVAEGIPVPPPDALTSEKSYRTWLRTLTDDQLRAVLEREERRRIAALSNDELLEELAKVQQEEIYG